MNHIKLMKQFLVLFSFLIIPTLVHAQNKDWTDVTECEKIVRNFDQSAFQALFNPKSNLSIKATKFCNPNLCQSNCNIDFTCESGCSTDTSFRHDNTRAFVGSVQLYRQQNSALMFTNNKNSYGANAKVRIVQNENSSLKHLFPWIVEGYYEYKNGANTQEFSAYTKNGDYLIFVLNYKKISPFIQPSEDKLDDRFIKFMQITSKQMGYY